MTRMASQEDFTASLIASIERTREALKRNPLPPELVQRSRMLAILEPPGSHPRDYRLGDDLWASQTLPPGISVDEAIRSGLWDSEAWKPGNPWILPHQATQRDRGGDIEIELQYPFFRSRLVEMGLLPSSAPQGTPKEVSLPRGMSVLDAIQAGVIR